MNARGTRRPHVRRVRSKPVRISGGGGKKSGLCGLVALALLSAPALLAAGAADLIGRAL